LRSRPRPEYVEPRAEADHAEALAASQALAFPGPAEDAARYQSGDLHRRHDGAVRQLEQKAVALVVLARLVEVGVEELARPIGDTPDGAGDRRPIDVAVEDVHEDRHPGARLRPELQLGRRHGLDHRLDPSVGGADDQSRPARHDPVGVAEEDHHPAGERQQQPEDRLPEQPQQNGRRQRAADEGIALAVDGRDRVADGMRNAHGGFLTLIGDSSPCIVLNGNTGTAALG
jgi:hypothetical protein